MHQLLCLSLSLYLAQSARSRVPRSKKRCYYLLMAVIRDSIVDILASDGQNGHAPLGPRPSSSPTDRVPADASTVKVRRCTPPLAETMCDLPCSFKMIASMNSYVRILWPWRLTVWFLKLIIVAWDEHSEYLKLVWMMYSSVRLPGLQIPHSPFQHQTISPVYLLF